MSNPADEYELCTVCNVNHVYHGGVCDECKEDNKVDWQEQLLCNSMGILCNSMGRCFGWIVDRFGLLDLPYLRKKMLNFFRM